MINMILLTGFLGSGKTTFLKKLLEEYKTSNVGVIVNEFGEINIDAKLIKKDGLLISELSNGSIFCACIKENFISSLIKMASNDLDYLFIEASGLADPCNMNKIVETIKNLTVFKYNYCGSICIIDGENFIETSKILKAVDNQVLYADKIIVNKKDLLKDHNIISIEEHIKKINKSVDIIFTSYCEINIKSVISSIKSNNLLLDHDTTNTIENRPFTFTLKISDTITMKELNEFLNFISQFTFRIKGFVRCKQSFYSISCVKNHIMILPWGSDVERTELVLISSIGISLTSAIADGIRIYAPGKINI